MTDPRFGPYSRNGGTHDVFWTRLPICQTISSLNGSREHGSELRHELPCWITRCLNLPGPFHIISKFETNGGKWILCQVLYNYMPVPFGVLESWICCSAGCLAPWSVARLGRGVLDESRLRTEGLSRPRLPFAGSGVNTLRPKKLAVSLWGRPHVPGLAGGTAER